MRPYVFEQAAEGVRDGPSIYREKGPEPSGAGSEAREKVALHGMTAMGADEADLGVLLSRAIVEWSAPR